MQFDTLFPLYNNSWYRNTWRWGRAVLRLTMHGLWRQFSRHIDHELIIDTDFWTDFVGGGQPIHIISFQKLTACNDDKGIHCMCTCWNCRVELIRGSSPRKNWWATLPQLSGQSLSNFRQSLHNSVCRSGSKTKKTFPPDTTPTKESFRNLGCGFHTAWVKMQV